MSNTFEFDSEFFIREYGMNVHPEGGYYVESYRSHETIPQTGLPKRFNGDRSFCSEIHFLLIGNVFSAFHRIKSDETWHFYYGHPLELIIIHQDGRLQTVLMGGGPFHPSYFQFTVPQGAWFASRCTNEHGFSFAGCTVAPGFDFNDFELAVPDELSNEFPAHEKLIRQFCR